MNRTRALFSKALIAGVACLALAACAAPAAQADLDVSSFGIAIDQEGGFSRQAGAHADLRVHLEFASSGPSAHVEGNLKDLRVDMPPGFVPNPTAIPSCAIGKLIRVGEPAMSDCPSEDQVGVATVITATGTYTSPVFNMRTTDDLPGLFGLNVNGAPVFIEPAVRPGDFGITGLSADTSQAERIESIDLALWGVPFDHGTGAQVRRPFLSAGTACAGPVSFAVSANSWQEPATSSTSTVGTDLGGVPFIYTGCYRLPFEPTIEAQVGTHRAHSPAGLNLAFQVPQNEGPDALASAHVRKVISTFPEGVTVSPSAVAGLGACTPAQVGLGSNSPPSCPDSSKIGNVRIKSQLLEKPLEGEVTLASQHDNPFHSTFAVYILAKAPSVYLKIPAELNIDKQTGQLRTILDNLPQLPFEEVRLDLRGGPTAPLTTPDVCGTYNTHSEFFSRASSIPVTSDNEMIINENCGGGGEFKPTLQAGVANAVAGANSPLTLRVRREDGEQDLSRLEFVLPEGELAKLKGVEVCPEAQVATGNCAKAAQVGISTTAIGTGAFPLFVPQPGKDPTALYLAGPYKGAPYSLLTKVPAQSGPFDFGDILVRTAIDINPVTTRVIAKSDPLPQTLEGVPIQYRDVRIEVQKPDFTVNPTSCEQRAVTTTITSVNGALAHPSVPSKVGDCGALGFKPSLGFKLSGGNNRGDFQGFTVTFKTRAQDSNLAGVSVTLPHAEFLEQSHIKTVCTRVQFAAKRCPKDSIYGYASAETPLLDKKLQGPVYLRSSSHALPDIVAELNGQFNIELAGRIGAYKGGRIKNTFEVVPDAPVRKFVVKLNGGKQSLLVNSRNLCLEPIRAEVKMIGQNGRRHNESPVVDTGCGKSKHSKSKRKG